MSYLKTGSKILIIALFIVNHAALFSQTNSAEVSYTLPDSLIAGIPFEVSMKFNRENIQGIARIQQVWPIGFTINEVDNAGSIFSMSKSQLQFLWISLPDKNEINLKFEVTANKTYSGFAEIPTVCIYLENNARKEIELSTLKINILGASNDLVKKSKSALNEVKKTTKIDEKIATIESKKEITKPASTAKLIIPQPEPKATAKQLEPAKHTNETKKIQATDTLNQNKIPVKKSSSLNSVSKQETNNEKKTSENVNKKTDSNSINNQASTITFKIQLTALPQKTNTKTLADEFGLEEKEIAEEKHNGLFKYTFGEFPTHTAARNKLNSNKQMKSKSFITGYRNGLRIDLEEAIRLSKTN